MAQEGGDHGAGCSSTTPPTKTSGASAWECCMESFRRKARRAAGCPKMTRDRPMSTINPGNGKRITSPKLLQVTRGMTRVLKNRTDSTQYSPPKHAYYWPLLIFSLYDWTTSLPQPLWLPATEFNQYSIFSRISFFFLLFFQTKLRL